jgi:hypothetical protein
MPHMARRHGPWITDYIGAVPPFSNDPKQGPGFARSITGCAVYSITGTPNCNKLSVRVSFVEEVLFG